MNNNNGHNMDFIEVETPPSIKYLVTNYCQSFNETSAGTQFLIKPSCLIYDKEANGFREKTETVIGRGLFKNIEKEILPTLERSELEGIPRIFIKGKYKAMTQLIAQAKYKYPDRLMILKNVGGLKTCLIIIYRSDVDKFAAIEPSHLPMKFNITIKGDII